MRRKFKYHINVYTKLYVVYIYAYDIREVFDHITGL